MPNINIWCTKMLDTQYFASFSSRPLRGQKLVVDIEIVEHIDLFFKPLTGTYFCKKKEAAHRGRNWLKRYLCL